jgi:cytochrome c oxidase cbb3-type subunit 1
MWVSGIMQALMWRETNELGFLVNSFAETVDALYPYYVARVFGGVLYLAGGLVMAYNIFRTIRGDLREAPSGSAAAVPAE